MSKNENTRDKAKRIYEYEISIKIEPIYNFLNKHWVLLAIVIIFFLSFYIRVIGFNYNYLRNIDSYWHYRYMKMIVENNGKLPSYDTLMEAPEYRKIEYMHFYHYLGAYSYMLFRIFFPNVELWRFLIYFPAFLASLAVIPCYFIGKRLYDKKAGIFLSIFLLFNTAIMSRTLGGDPDSDAIVLLLPLIILSFFFELIHSVKNSDRKKSMLYSFMTGLFMAILAYTWVSWHVFYFISGAIFIEIIITWWQKENTKIKNLLFSYIITIIVFLLLTVPVIGFSFIKIIIGGPFEALKLKAEEGDFPNVYVSVAEMMEGGNVKNVGRNIGIYLIQDDFTLGKNIVMLIYTTLYFLIIIFTYIYILFSYITKRKHLESLIFLTLWGGGFLYASIYAIRFSIFLVLPLALILAIFLSKVWRIALKEDESILD